jgi:23S rRNA pseudouridine1911/1915/1917 synthase
MNNHTYNPETNLLPSRLDKLLARLSGFSRSKTQNMIKAGTVIINNFVELDPGRIISKECEISITEISTQRNDNLTAKKIDFEIIYEDEDLLVINKPAGLTVHPGAGNYDDTLVNGLLYLYQDRLSSINQSDRPGIVHRIDRDTSGLLMIAKNNATHLSLASQIEHKIACRSYLSIIWGFPKQSEGDIKTNIGRSNSDRTKMTVLNFGGKIAVTHYKLLEIYAGGLFSLCECKLETGRTHQIRVHMSHIGHSIVGDQTYGSNERKAKQIRNDKIRSKVLGFKRQALHAYKLSFIHPTKNTEMNFEISLPNDIRELVNFINLNFKI